MEEILLVIDIIEELLNKIKQFSVSTWISLVGLALFYIGIKPMFSEYTNRMKVSYIIVGIVIIAIAQSIHFIIPNGGIAF